MDRSRRSPRRHPRPPRVRPRIAASSSLAAAIDASDERDNACRPGNGGVARELTVDAVDVFVFPGTYPPSSPGRREGDQRDATLLRRGRRRLPRLRRSLARALPPLSVLRCAASWARAAASAALGRRESLGPLGGEIVLEILRDGREIERARRSLRTGSGSTVVSGRIPASAPPSFSSSRLPRDPSPAAYDARTAGPRGVLAGARICPSRRLTRRLRPPAAAAAAASDPPMDLTPLAGAGVSPPHPSWGRHSVPGHSSSSSSRGSTGCSARVEGSPWAGPAAGPRGETGSTDWPRSSTPPRRPATPCWPRTRSDNSCGSGGTRRWTRRR